MLSFCGTTQTHKSMSTFVVSYYIGLSISCSRQSFCPGSRLTDSHMLYGTSSFAIPTINLGRYRAHAHWDVFVLFHDSPKLGLWKLFIRNPDDGSPDTFVSDDHRRTTNKDTIDHIIMSRYNCSSY